MLYSSFSSVCPTLCYPMDCSMPGLPVHHHLLEFTQTHVHWVGNVIQPSHSLSSPSPPAFNLSQHHCFFKWVSSSHQVARVLEFQLQYQSFQRIFILNDIYFKCIWNQINKVLVAQSCPTLCDPIGCGPPKLFGPLGFPGKHTVVGCHTFLQGIFPTQETNLDLLHCRQTFYCLSNQGSSVINYHVKLIIMGWIIMTFTAKNKGLNTKL